MRVQSPPNSFPHLSIQEFLAAWYIACDVTLTVFFSFLPLTNLKTVAKFLAGLVGCGSFPITEWMKKDTKFMVHCLFEAQDSCKALEGHVFTNCVAYTSMTPLDMYVFGYVLVHARSMD